MNIKFGCDYYPEHWPKDRWIKDAKLMSEMGIQVVRLGEFSWHKFEPKEGQFDFYWLEEIINILAEYGIKVVLGTPTAAPPAWMINAHPEILPIDMEGRRRGFGGRHHDCQSNPLYREYCKKLVTHMAKYFGHNINVIGWQTDNELGNGHGDLCTCESCRKTFQFWLKNKYENTDNLNKAWGTCFWSQEYNDFSEVFPPHEPIVGKNPAQMLDWRRFCSDLVRDFNDFQVKIIRENTENQFVTHNFMGFADKVDYYDLSKTLDFVSHDQYPGGFFAEPPHKPNHVNAAELDVVRSYKNKPFWIMEQQAGITGWEEMGRAPEPGQLSEWTLQSIAHGADTIVYFRWRTCTVGTEQYWHGILPHSGIPGRTYFELKDTIEKISPIMDSFKGSMPNSKVGIVFSYKQLYALGIQRHHKDLNYLSQLLKYYKALYALKISVDFVSEEGDFSKYKLLIAPLQYIMTGKLENKYRTYVENGGRLVMTMRTGVKDDNNNCISDKPLPGGLSDVLGITIPEYDCLYGTSVKIRHNGNVFDSYIWSDIIQLETAEIVATYNSEFYTGKPAVTKNKYGKGRAYYIGTEPSEDLMSSLLRVIIGKAGVKSLGTADEDVEIVERSNENCSWYFVINHSDRVRKYSIRDKGADLIFGDSRGHLNPHEVHIFMGDRINSGKDK